MKLSLKVPTKASAGNPTHQFEVVKETVNSKRKTWKRRFVVALLVIAALPLLASGAAQFLVVRVPVTNADAIVVMSGSGTYRERAQHAAELFNEGRAPRIVLTNDYLQSSWSAKEQRNPYYYERSIEELRRAGVPDDKIAVIMVPIRSTYDEAVLLKKYSEENHLSSLLVVTSAYHSRRVYWTFRKVFAGTGTAIGIDPAEPKIESPSASTWWLHRSGWEVPKEYAKIFVYWFRYRGKQ
jgi:uncharacterized SAM-binding protein YcdF (DUF218 family)